MKTHIIASSLGVAQRYRQEEAWTHTVVLVHDPAQLQGLPYDRIEFLSWPLHWTHAQVEEAQAIMETARLARG